MQITDIKPIIYDITNSELGVVLAGIGCILLVLLLIL